MTSLKPTEKKFEEHIESHLNSVGYATRHWTEYARSLCVLREDVMDFIRATQPDAWMDRAKDKIGYEINFTKYFYHFAELRTVQEITDDLKSLDNDINALFSALESFINQ